VSPMTPVSSQIVGAWTLLWRVWSYAWRSGRERSLALTGLVSSLSPGTDPLDSTEMLVVRQIPGTSGAPRWLLISGSVQSLVGSPAIFKSGRSSVAGGNSGVDDGVEGSTIPTTST